MNEAQLTISGNTAVVATLCRRPFAVLTFRDGSAKIFQLPLPSNKLTANQMRGVDIKSVLASTSAESAEVAALEEEMATELAKEAVNKGKGSAQSSPELNETPPIAPTPSKRAEVDRCGTEA